MSTPAAIAADFATYRHVQGRKVVQIVLEIPAELAAQMFSTLGHPGAGEPIPVAVARLAMPGQARAEIEPPRDAAETKTARRFDTLPLPQQAALLCQDEGFWRWLRLQNQDVATMESAVAWLRSSLDVKSRTEIVAGSPVAERFFRIRDGFHLWQRGIPNRDVAA